MKYNTIIHEKTIRFIYDEDIEIHFYVSKNNVCIKYTLIGCPDDGTTV